MILSPHLEGLKDATHVKPDFHLSPIITEGVGSDLANAGHPFLNRLLALFASTATGPGILNAVASLCHHSPHKSGQTFACQVSPGHANNQVGIYFRPTVMLALFQLLSIITCGLASAPSSQEEAGSETDLRASKQLATYLFRCAHLHPPRPAIDCHGATKRGVLATLCGRPAASESDGVPGLFAYLLLVLFLLSHRRHQ